MSIEFFTPNLTAFPVVSTITSGPGMAGVALISGFVLGLSAVRTVDHYYSRVMDFQNRWKYLTGAGITILAIGGVTLVSLASKISAKSAAFFTALSSGVILGIQIQEHCNKNSDQKMNEFMRGLEATSPCRNEPALSLIGHRGCLNYFNLAKLGQKIHERFQANSELQLLDLSETDLTDNNLKEMAQTGLFDNVRRLVLRDNPRLTGRGVAWLAEKGFTGLQELDLSRNKQVTKTGLNEWIEKDGFKNLTILNLSATGIRENELEQMIEKAEWFRNLKGLNLDWNDELRKIPSNILMLEGLDDHNVGEGQVLSNGPIYFRGAGIFCRGCKSLTCTVELLQLANKGKVVGAVNGLPLNIRNIFNSMDIKKIYKAYKVE